MGCQKDIATQIRAKGGDYLLGLKAGFTHEPGGLLTEDCAGRSLIQAIRDERYDGRFSSVLRRAR
jgi:hypothetical protein